MSEKEIVIGCINGELRAQRILFDKFAGKMMTVCRRYAGQGSDAEDFFQESFIRVFQNLHQFQFQGSLEGWIRRVVVHACIRQLSKRKLTYSLDSDNMHFEPEVDNLALSSLSEEEIINWINMMPIGYKTVFNLVVFDGFSHKEVSSMMSIDEATSRSQLLKGRKWLQKRVVNAQKVKI